MRRLAIMIAFLLFGVSLVSTTGPAYALDKDCSDFDTQAQAQAWHNDHPEDGLDSDGDGVACETLPCPCSSGDGGGNGGDGGTPPPKLKKHIIKIQGMEIRDTDKFKLFGKIPTYKNGKGVQIQKKVKQGRYKAYKVTRVNGLGKIRKITVEGKIGTCYKAVVPKRGIYRKTEKVIGCIVKE